MEENFITLSYKKKDFEDLKKMQLDSNLVCNGQPDRYQYYQNQLVQKLAEFVLKPYWECMKIEREKKPLEILDFISQPDVE